MLLFILLAAQLDTLQLPEPAAAITADEHNRLAFITNNTGELITQVMEDSALSWHNTSLPRSFNIMDRILVSGDRLYVLSQRELVFCDLRYQNSSVIADDVDDAVLSTYGELWITRQFTLAKTTLLGRKLEETSLLREPSSMWMIEDSLVLLYPDETLDMPSWFDELGSGIKKEELRKINRILAQPDPALIASGKKVIYIMIDPRHVIRIRKPVK